MLLGSWITLQTSDEGQVMLLESETTDQMVRTDHSVIRLQTIDPKTGQPERGEELELPFRPGAFSWCSSEKAALYATTPHVAGVPLVWNLPATVVVFAVAMALAILLSLRILPGAGSSHRRVARLVMQAAWLVAAIFVGVYLGYPEGVVRHDVLNGPEDPVRLVVKDYIAASSPPVWVPDGSGRAENGLPPSRAPPGPIRRRDSRLPHRAAGEHPSWRALAQAQNDIDDPLFEDLVVGGRTYRLAFDFDRRSIGFDLTLVDFEMGTDPGTQEASTYTSRVVLNDPAQGVEGKAVTITMNEPLRYRGKTFYQQGFRELHDADTGRKTGDKKSVIQVGIDPYWGIKYAGCLLVVLGIFVQFAMRTGLFEER